MVSPRIAPAVFGVGLLEAVPDDALLAIADPDDADGDGISGRANRVLDPSGDVGHRAVRMEGQRRDRRAADAGAFHGDIGITSTLHPEQDCTAAQPECRAAIDGGQPELDDAKLERVTFYTRTLAVPARRDVGDPDTDAGAQLFDELGCSSCHRPELHTGEAEVAATSNQTIRPYTDLLLHDMGAGLADGRPDGEATRQRVADRAAVGHRPHRRRQRPHPAAPRRSRPRRGRGDPVARRRGGRRPGSVRTARRVGTRTTARVLGLAVRRLVAVLVIGAHDRRVQW